MNEKIFSLSKQEKICALKNRDVRNFYLRDENYYPFVWLVQGLGDYLHFFIDDDYLKEIISQKNGCDMINAIMSSDSNDVGKVLSTKEAVSFIVKNKHRFSYISYLDYCFCEALIDYAFINNDFKCLELLQEFNEETQLKAFYTDNIIRFLKLKTIDSNIFLYLKSKVINKLIVYKPFLDILLNYTIDSFNSLIEQGLVLPKYLLNNKKIIDKYVQVFFTNKYRLSINALMKSNVDLAINIERERREYIKKELININEKGYLKRMDSYFEKDFIDLSNELPFITFGNLNALYYKNRKDELVSRFVKLTLLFQLEQVIDIMFKDIAYNFLANLKVMLEYITNVKESIINTEHLELYKKIYTFDQLSMEERINFIKKIDDNYDYAKMFYEDYQKCRFYSYKEMNESITKLSRDSSLYNEELSQKNEVDIYELNGEEFYMYIHVTGKSRSEGVFGWNEDGFTPTLSLTLIGKKCIGMFNEDSIVVGFLSLKPSNIMHVYHSDSYTIKSLGSKKVNQIYTPDILLDNTEKYNEILYDGKIKPDVIVCCDTITHKELLAAKEMGLPILKIDTNKYRKDGKLELYSENNYLSPSSMNDPILEGKRY